MNNEVRKGLKETLSDGRRCEDWTQLGSLDSRKFELSLNEEIVKRGVILYTGIFGASLDFIVACGKCSIGQNQYKDFERKMQVIVTKLRIENFLLFAQVSDGRRTNILIVNLL